MTEFPVTIFRYADEKAQCEATAYFREFIRRLKTMRQASIDGCCSETPDFSLARLQGQQLAIKWVFEIWDNLLEELRAKSKQKE